MMKRSLSLLILTLGAGLLALPAWADDEESSAGDDSAAVEESAAASGKIIYVYQDGVPTAVEVPADVEFLDVAREDINVGNIELLKMASLDVDGSLALGYGYADKGSNKVGAEKYGQRPNGPQGELDFTNEYRATNWFQFGGEYVGPDAWNYHVDQSNARWSLDGAGFEREGWVYGADADGDDNPYFTYSKRHRQQHELTFRRGSMEGGNWLVKLRKYDVENNSLDAETAAYQQRDVYFRSGTLTNRGTEGDWYYKFEGEYGKYASKRALMDNNFWRAGAEAGTSLSRRLDFGFDADLKTVDAQLQGAQASYLSAGAELDYELSHSLSLNAGMRNHSASDDVVGNTSVTGWNEASAGLHYRPNQEFSFDAKYRIRDFDLERLKIEDAAFDELYAADPPPTRAELAQYREDVTSSSDRYELGARWRPGCRWSIHASYGEENFDSLPGSATLAQNLEAASLRSGSAAGTGPNPSYMPDRKSWGDLHVDYEIPCGGRFSFVTTHDSMENSARDVSSELSRYALNYSDSLNRCTRWQAGVSRVESDVNLPAELTDWNGKSWNYSLSLSGDQRMLNYRLSYGHQNTDGFSGGDFDSVGLELGWKECPFYLSGWWRERANTLWGGLADYDDTGVNVGYRWDIN